MRPNLFSNGRWYFPYPSSANGQTTAYFMSFADRTNLPFYISNFYSLIVLFAIPIVVVMIPNVKIKAKFQHIFLAFLGDFQHIFLSFLAIFWSNLELISCPRAVAARSSRHNFPSRGE